MYGNKPIFYRHEQKNKHVYLVLPGENTREKMISIIDQLYPGAIEIKQRDFDKLVKKYGSRKQYMVLVGEKGIIDYLENEEKEDLLAEKAEKYAYDEIDNQAANHKQIGE